jgi:phosphoribosyl 1,2-cyclic phosphodiesterase
LIYTEKTKILVDCGISGKAAISSLEKIGINPAEIDGILITHEHADHIKGVGILHRKLRLPIYANTSTWKAMQNEIGKIDENLVTNFDVDKHFEIGDVSIKSFSIPHDAADPVGFSFFYGNKKVTIATDIGHVTPSIEENVSGSSAALIESNHDPDMLEVCRYPAFLKRRIAGQNGHLANLESAKLAVKLVISGAKHILLGHLSLENNMPDLAYHVTKSELKKNNITVGEDMYLGIAGRDDVSEICSA